MRQHGPGHCHPGRNRGHELTLFDVDPAASEQLASEVGGTKPGGARVAVAETPTDGIPDSDIVILASWFLANVETATQLGAELQGKGVVDISNPLNRSNDWLVTPPESSAAEAVRDVLPDRVSVVKTRTRMGHLHLHVGDLEQAASFYSEAMGFDRTVWHYPGALFLAAGGYHHHLGTNTRAGNGATPPEEQDARLLEWTIELPDETSLSRCGESLTRAGYSIEAEGGPAQLVTLDPWGTQLRLVAGGTTT